jgi:uncharacterized repeat protein (TIGR03803 family)
VIQGSDGYLYGTTFYGGPNGGGTVYRVMADGSNFSVLHSFSGDCADGCYPSAGVIQGSDGYLYGTTGEGGTGRGGVVYRLVNG